MQPFKLSSLLILIFSSVILVSCDTEDPFRIDPPDFTTVPEPYDTSNVESVDLQDGVKAYLHEEGYGPFQITARDQVYIYLTLRTESGKIIYSTFSDERDYSVPVSMELADGKNPDVHTIINRLEYTIQLSFTPGFKMGLLGMKTGAKRTLVVSPEKGYKNIPANVVNQSYRDSTLIYDFQIADIGPKKSR